MANSVDPDHVGFFRSQLIWIYTVCKGKAYPGSSGQGLIISQINIVLFLNKNINCGYSYLQIRRAISIIFFLILRENIDCRYPLEAPPQGTSDVYHNPCFHGEITKMSVLFNWKKIFICRYGYSLEVRCFLKISYLPLHNFFRKKKYQYFWLKKKGYLYAVKIITVILGNDSTSQTPLNDRVKSFQKYLLH